MSKFAHSLFGRVVIALILGIALGIFVPAFAVSLKPIGDGFIKILAATLSAVPAIPVIGLALLVPVDWFIGIGRALTNLLGNCVATMVIATWEKDIDREKALAVLDGTEAAEMALDAVAQRARSA